MVGSTEVSIFEIRRPSNIVCSILDTSGRACPSALVV